MNRHSPSGALETTAASLTLVDHILELEGATTDELVEATDLAKNTVHAHLKMFTEYGCVTSADNEYHLGAKFCHLGDYVRARKDYYRVAQETALWLGSESPIDTDFTVEEHGRIALLYGDLEFANMPRFLIDGSPFHVHATCSGKVVIAEYPEMRVRETIDRWGLPVATDDSITTENELFTKLATIRKQGYAEDSGETVEGSWTIGKAVESSRGEVYGSLNLSGLTYVIGEEMRATQVELLKRAVERFEQGVTELYQTQANEPNEERERGRGGR